MSILSEINKTTLFCKAIVLAIIVQINALQATTITVTATDGTIADDGLCSISEAIISANTDTASGAMGGECVAGVTGLDTINLTTDVVFQNFYQDEPTFGHTSTPTISSHLIIDGVGHTLQRNNSLNCNINEISTADEFRILYVSSTGILDLKNISIKNGCADGNHLNRRAGGGILNGGILTIDNSELSANTSELGGSIANIGTITSISNSLITNNHSDNLGGGIFNQSIITEITNNWFAGNSAFLGAGMTNLVGSIEFISQNTFSNNQAMQDGGGIFSHDGGSVTAIVNNTFSANSANFGAGLYNYNSTISSLKNNTFSENSANFEGGGIFNRGTLLGINNNLFNKNMANSNKDCHIADGTVSGSNNLSNQVSNNCTGAIITSSLGSNTVGLLVDNGCITLLSDGSCAKTHALLAGSQALDAAVTGISTDQRGFTIVDSLRDIGAFERLPAQDQCNQIGIDTKKAFSLDVSTASDLNAIILCANVNLLTTDTINLTSDIIFQSFYQKNANGKTASADIASPIVLDGMGHTLERDNNLACIINETSETDEFRLLYIASNGNLDLKNISIKNGCVDGGNNNSSSGGGVFSDGNLTINTSQFINNKAIKAGAVENYGTITSINNSLFFNNKSLLEGGAINNLATINEINNSTFSNNRGHFGGGFSNDGTINAISNTTFYGNTSFSDGGGIYNNSIINNLNNNLFNMNIAPFGIDCFNGIGTISGNNNLSTHPSSNCGNAGFISGLDSNTVEPLADNGCMTPLADGTCIKTHALLADSQAIDISISGTTIDQRGYSNNGIRDIGAYEYDSPDEDIIFKNGFE